MHQVKHYITFKVAPVRLPGALEWSANARPVADNQPNAWTVHKSLPGLPIQHLAARPQGPIQPKGP
jgi:hypothetical protein